MNDKLNWGYQKHDFSSIQETLSKYFPVENPEHYNKKNIGDFKGVKAIEEILDDNFCTNKRYLERWGKFKKFLKQELKKPIHETMIAWYPCYSGFITLKKEKFKNITYTKELHFFISLLGPYYTILGIDRSEVELEEVYPDLDSSEKIKYRVYDASHVLTVSPYQEYKELFLILQNKVLEYFPSFKYIPYDINKKKVKGISLVYPDCEAKVKGSVFSALFRPEVSFNTETRGETSFGFNEWLIVKKLDRNRIKEIHEALVKKALKDEFNLTIHKVWKLKAANRIPMKISGMFGMDPIKIVDLTDNNIITIISKEDEEPGIS